MRKGFTLVELSIVLVIIGLLIGGILTAQSMINTAKISAQVRQIGQFDAMVLSFKTKFNYLPGDAPAFGGDGDGVLDATTAPGIPDDIASIYTCELPNFWFSLDSDVFPSTPASSCDSDGLQAVTAGSNKNVPGSKIGATGSFFIAASFTTDSSGYMPDKSNPRNFYIILHGTQLQSPFSGRYHIATTSSANSAVKPVDLLALDKKVDDGLADSGNIISGAITNAGCGAPGCGAPYSSPLATCSSGAVYRVQNDSYECTPLIRIGGSVGLPQ